MDLIRQPKIENVRMIDRLTGVANSISKSSSSGPLGTLYLTPTHLIFVDKEGGHESWVLHSHLSSIEKLSVNSLGTPLQIRCKNFQSITFILPREKDAHEVWTSLFNLSQPLSYQDLYCFRYSASNEPFKDQRDKGWNKYDYLSEFRRQGAPNKNWVISDLNLKYELCETYPKHLLLPASATEQMIRASAGFRSKSRLPVLSYLYSKNGASVCRCSQPLSGFNSRCEEDESLMNAILQTQSSSKVLYIVDTRPIMNAYANKAAGKGFENEKHYDNMKFNFFGIENIHVMRGSLNRLLEASEMFSLSSDAFLSALGSSGWLKHIKSVLEAAAFVVKAIQDGISVVVHCSDGWDRTAQTCSLAALLLDPYYRTLNGFQVLIEKEWLSFGHKFTERCGHIQTGDTKEQAPVFTQFVDCIWQVLQQFPSEFEFNEQFLLLLHDHVYSCQFGNFICNSEKERQDMKVREKSYSLWSYLDARRDTLTNPLYYVKRRSLLGGNDRLREQVLTLNTSPQIIKFWRHFYNRFESGIHPKESIDDLMVVTYNHISSLERHIMFLESKLKSSQQRQQSAIQGKGVDVNKDLLLVDTSGSTAKLSSSSKGSSSFDSIDYPLKIVKQCMQRLETKQREDEEEAIAATGSADREQSVTRDVKEETESRTVNQIAREKLRLDDLKIVYPEGKINRSNAAVSATTAAAKTKSITESSNISPPPTSVVTACNATASASSRVKLVSKTDFDKDQLVKDVNSVAIEWQALRNAKECPCGYLFEQTSTRRHCYSCGKLFCVRCIDRKIMLPGHVIPSANPDSSSSSDVFESPDNDSFDLVSVCRSCHRLWLDRDSLTSPAM